MMIDPSRDPASDGAVEALAAAILPAHPHMRGLVWQALREVIYAEREACARVIESMPDFTERSSDMQGILRDKAAAAIRARGED